jgi:TRAP transporter TAXI family solute receptor
VITRRAVLTGALAAGAGVGLGRDQAPDDSGTVLRLKIATGERWGSYLPFGQLLVRKLRATYPRIRAVAVPTEASVANLRLLASGQVDLAFTLADIAESALFGLPPFGGPVKLRALGRIFENYLQLAVRADSPVRSVEQLAGKTLSLGAPGSGGAVLGARLLTLAGLTSVKTLHLLMPEARLALRNRTIDGMLVTGGVPLKVLALLDAEIGIRLLPLSPFLSVLRPPDETGYEAVRMPPGAYHPGSEVDTIGVANLLVCREDLAPGVAWMVTDTLVRRAAALIPAEAVGTQFLDVRSLIDTGTVPLHPGAIAAYRASHG